MSAPPSLPVVFVYLGRRGALARLALELAQAAPRVPELRATFVISRMNASVAAFPSANGRLLLVDTFKTAFSAALATNFFRLRRVLLARVAQDQPAAVVALAPHVWTPLLIGSVQSAGARYATVIHDAVGHPGDATGLLTPWLRSEASRADLSITLSRAVAEDLARFGRVSEERVLPLFLPDLTYGGNCSARRREPDAPLRLLFFGRILRYKGLPLLVEAIEQLKEQGLPVHLGVVGAGNIDRLRCRLERLGAEIINRWVDDCEIPGLLARYDAMALPHMEASQSGAAALAFGNAMPAIGMPVGGIAEQVVEGRTGVLARAPTAAAFAEAVRRLALDRKLYERLSSNLEATRGERSMEEFLRRIVVQLHPSPNPSPGSDCGPRWE